MMYSQRFRRYKWKEMTLAGLYLAFMLALVGEFFYALKTQESAAKAHERVKNHEELPVHIPEDSKIEFIRSLRLRNRSHD